MNYRDKTLIRGESLYIKVKLYSENSVTGRLEPYDAQELTTILESTKNGEIPMMISEARLSDGKRIPLTIIQELDDGVAVDGELSLFSDVDTRFFPGESFDVNIILKKQMDLGFRDGNNDVVLKDVKSATFNETFYLAWSATRIEEQVEIVEPTPVTPTPTPTVQYSEGLLFEDIDENTCRCIGRGNCVDTMLVIPPTHEGKTVVGIGGFEGDFLISLYLPDTIRKIGARCFLNCSSLSSIRFPENDEFRVALFAFSRTALETLTIPANFRAGLRDEFEYDVTVSGNSIFYDCDYLRSVVFEEGFNFDYRLTREGNIYEPNVAVARINGASMFSDCDNLSSVSIPTTLDKIPQMLFYSCESLTEIRFTAPVINDMEETAFSQKMYVSGQTPIMTDVYFACKNAPGVRYRVGESGSPVTFHYDGSGIGWEAFKTKMAQYSPGWGAAIYWVDESQNGGNNA